MPGLGIEGKFSTEPLNRVHCMRTVRIDAPLDNVKCAGYLGLDSSLSVDAGPGVVLI